MEIKHMLLGFGKSVLKYKIKLFKLERRLGKKDENSFTCCLVKLVTLLQLI